MSEDIIKKFEKETRHTAWINSDIYPDGKIYTKQFTEWLQSENKRLREERDLLMENFEEECNDDREQYKETIRSLREELEKTVIDFAEWYSGMEREKVINSYHRYKKEVTHKDK